MTIEKDVGRDEALALKHIEERAAALKQAIGSLSGALDDPALVKSMQAVDVAVRQAKAYVLSTPRGTQLEMF